MAAVLLLRAAVDAGASRQVAAAVASALWRHLMEPLHTDSEVAARLDMVQPMLRKLVNGERPCGDDRAMRNTALHADFGCGASALPKNAKEAKRRQRGRRRLPDEVQAKSSVGDGWDGSSRGSSEPEKEHTAIDGL